MIEAPSEPLTSDVESVSPVPASKAELGTQHMPIQLGAGQSVRSLTALSRQTAGDAMSSGANVGLRLACIAAINVFAAHPFPWHVVLLPGASLSHLRPPSTPSSSSS